jgi:hypothetical protein
MKKKYSYQKNVDKLKKKKTLHKKGLVEWLKV